MRLFIATDIPHTVVSSVLDFRKKLERESQNVRWVREESLHLTLEFLGEVSESRIGEIDGRLANIDMPPFRVKVAGIGFFPNERAPRVFWAGVESERLEALVGAVEREMAELGFGSGTRKFSPHLTLAKSKGKSRIESRFVEQVQVFRDHEFGRFETDRFFLYESRLDSSGAVYTKLAEYLLGQRPPMDRTEE